MKTKTRSPQKIAEDLIQSVGPEEAVYYCYLNQWMGVLAHLPRDVAIRHL